ncbi:NADH-quinone oxidoreductase subunit C [Adhaeribacter aquaticus]|uniref:NADH-quinone oxidoreductase subunit C n=1 Tax=Adhaeribacter aquaticus TaxID=299567 RepID=UPI0004009F24|nr:NADH-quinone oxidoreductase subunit C [Adhaeribacter aquaticus]
MTFEEIRNFIIDKFGSEVVVREHNQAPQPYLVIETARIADVCQELFSNPQTYFDYLACLTGLDNGPEAGTLEVIYNLYSIPYDHQLTLKVVTERLTPAGALPNVPTVAPIWKTADWHEREAYDLVGINFTGHPDLRRILCVDDWNGHPLRRDYEWPDYYHGIKVRYDNHNEVNGFKGEGLASTINPGLPPLVNEN